MKQLPLVSIISVHFNEPEATEKMLASTRLSGYTNLEVLVVDNGSTKGDLQPVVNKYPEVTFFKSNENLGFAGGNNLALPYAKGEVIFFLNNDALLHPDTISTMVDFLNNTPDAGLISPLICYPPINTAKRDLIQFAGTSKVSPWTGRNKTFGHKTLDFGQFDHPRVIPYVHGAAMMIKKELIAKYGSLDETYFLYYEELDWSERLNKTGFNNYLVPAARGYHHESLSTGVDSPLKVFFLNRSRMLFMDKHQNGIASLMFLLFYHLVVLPKGLFLYFIKGRLSQAKSLFKAVFSFWNYKFNHKKEKSFKNISLTPLLPSSNPTIQFNSKLK
ncbi:MAG: glycosyltransferase family 2 protein [Saprospiraceae bacterium]